MTEFTPGGFQVDRFPEIRQKLSDLIKAKFGDAMLVDSAESVVGILISVFASALDGQNGVIQGVVDSFNVQAATGVYQSNLVLLNNIKRKEAVYSVCSIDCTAGTAATTIPKGSVVTDSDELYDWITDIDLTLAPLETAAVSVTAKNPGGIFAEVDTLTKIKTPVYSWESVNNPLSSTIGQVEEGDTLLRLRRDRAATAGSKTSAPRIQTDIDAIDSVESSQVYENEKDVVDEYGNSAHSIWVIVKGGTDAELAEVLAKGKAAGITLIGDQVVTYINPVNLKEYKVRYSRPDEISTEITVTIKVNSAFPTDGVAQIKQQIINYYDGDFTIDGREVPGFDVGSDVVHSRLYSPVNSVPGHEITTLLLSRLGDTGGEITLPMEIYEQGVISEDDITVVVTT